MTVSDSSPNLPLSLNSAHSTLAYISQQWSKIRKYESITIIKWKINRNKSKKTRENWTKHVRRRICCWKSPSKEVSPWRGKYQSITIWTKLPRLQMYFVRLWVALCRSEPVRAGTLYIVHRCTQLFVDSMRLNRTQCRSIFTNIYRNVRLFLFFSGLLLFEVGRL